MAGASVRIQALSSWVSLSNHSPPQRGFAITDCVMYSVMLGIHLFDSELQVLSSTALKKISIFKALCYLL